MRVRETEREKRGEERRALWKEGRKEGRVGRTRKAGCQNARRERGSRNAVAGKIKLKWPPDEDEDNDATAAEAAR